MDLGHRHPDPLHLRRGRHGADRRDARNTIDDNINTNTNNTRMLVIIPIIQILFVFPAIYPLSTVPAIYSKPLYCYNISLDPAVLLK